MNIGVKEVGQLQDGTNISQQLKIHALSRRDSFNCIPTFVQNNIGKFIDY